MACMVRAALVLLLCSYACTDVLGTSSVTARTENNEVQVPVSKEQPGNELMLGDGQGLDGVLQSRKLQHNKHPKTKSSPKKKKSKKKSAKNSKKQHSKKKNKSKKKKNKSKKKKNKSKKKKKKSKKKKKKSSKKKCKCLECKQTTVTTTLKGGDGTPLSTKTKKKSCKTISCSCSSSGATPSSPSAPGGYPGNSPGGYSPPDGGAAYLSTIP